MQALLDEDDTQSQEDLAAQLQVTAASISLRLKAMGKIQKFSKWVPHDLNAPSHTAAAVKVTIEQLGWEILPHAAYSPDLAPSDYHLFASMGHALAKQRFTSYENLQKWLGDWFGSKDTKFYRQGVHKLPERWAQCIASEGRYFE